MTRQLKDGTIVPDTEIIDEVVKEYENLDEDAEMGGDYNEDQDDEDDFNALDDEEGEDEEDDNNDNGMEEIDPQILKMQERIKFLKHRCIGSLGNQLFEKALSSLQANIQKSADEIREILIKILGEESIGYWAILDQIVLFEGILDEMSTNDGNE